MAFFYELKNRALLIFIFQFNLFFASYIYKEIIYFLFISNLIISNKELCFLYTNITELFSGYLGIINFFTLQFGVVYTYYHFFVFMLPGLYSKEIIFLKKLMVILIHLVILAIFLNFYLIMPVIFLVFSNFNKMLTLNNLIYFEIRLLEYLFLFKEMYYLTFFYLVVIFIAFLLKINLYFNRINLVKFKKTYYYLFFLISTILTFDILASFFIFLIMILLFELICFSLIIKMHLIKR